jgi:hypothetical protein
MSKAKNSDPETFPLFVFRKLREEEPQQQQSRTEIKSLPLKKLDYWAALGIKKIVDEAMTPEVRWAFPEAEIIAQILKNPAVVVDAGKAEVVEAVQERVRFNLLTRWRGR